MEPVMHYDYQLAQNPTAATMAEAATAEVARLQTPTAGASPAVAFSRAPSLDAQRRGLELLALVQQYDALLVAGMSGPDAARHLGVSRSSIYKAHQKWLRAGQSLDVLVPQHHKAGRPRKHQLTADEIQAVKARKLIINRTRTSSSTPEALRQAAQRGDLTDATRAILENCQARGTGLPESILHDTHVPETTIRAYRSPREAWLDYVQSPGSLMLTVDQVTGEERPWHPGEAYTIDDGTINLGVCVPMERPGDPCWEEFRVLVGRFQLIPIVDHRTRCILGFNYTCRPKGSYRAEDLTATMQTVFAEHGTPSVMFLEHGSSASNLVKDTLRLLGIKPIYCASPHQKVVEMLFDSIWLKLSNLPGQVGRFRGEMEEEGKTYEACKRGDRDPRKYFPMLADLLQAIRTAIAEINQQWVHSPQYGDWQPGPWFAKDAPAATRPIPAGSEWMFSPCIAGPLVVRRMAIATSFTFMPGLSIKFHFAAPFLADLPGAEVKLYYNPFAPECRATIVLADEYQGRPAGTVLGTAEQINRHARYTRRKLGYGSDPDIGQAAAKQHAQELRRHVIAIRPDGKPGLQAVETRTYGARTSSSAGGEVGARTSSSAGGEGQVGARASSSAGAQGNSVARPSPSADSKTLDLLDRQAARARKLIALSSEH